MHFEHVRKEFKEKAAEFTKPARKKEKHLYLGKLTEIIDFCDNINDLFIQIQENLPRDQSRSTSRMIDKMVTNEMKEESGTFENKKSSFSNAAMNSKLM